MNHDVIKCPCCNSARVFELRIDSDWGGGIGNYFPVNDKDEDNEYTKEDLELDSFDRPDIDLYHCLNCDHMWEKYNP